MYLMESLKNNLTGSLLQFETKMSQGLFRDVMDQLQQQHGPYKTWLDPELSAISARCLSHLGMERTADAIIYYAWRRHPEHPDLVPAYLSVIRRHQGAVVAWKISQHLITLPLPDKLKANLLCEQAAITSDFRDFSQAETLIKQARLISASAWVLNSEAYLLFNQDKYDECYESLKKVLQLFPDYRPSRQLTAHILVLKGNLPEAVNTLSDIADTVQSVSLIQQLLYIHMDLKQYDLAEQYIEKLEPLYYEKNKYTKRYINYVKADILCSQQRYQDALPYLEEKSFFHKKLSDSIKASTDNSERCVLDVPFIRQHHMTCAPASMSAIAKYWGSEFAQEDIIKAICYDGTPEVDERHWIMEQGWLGVEFVLEFDTLKALIDKGIPVLLSTVEPGSAHLQIIVGYDKTLGLYFLRDPYHPRLQEILVDESHKYYASSGPRCMLMIPEKKWHLIEGIKLKDKTLYDENFKLNKKLADNKQDLAADIVKKMLAIDKENSLSIKAQRLLAIHDDNEPKILKHTETLLERYPDDVNLQLSKASSLSSMNSYQQTLNYLDSLYKKPFAHFLIKSRLARELVQDHRQQFRTEKLLNSLIRYASTDPNTLKAYADFLWGKSEHKESYDLYRFLTCLEDKSEHFAQSYFRAARYFKETDQALEFLIDRYNRYKNKSSGPVISLFNALNSLDRTQEGFAYIDEAIKNKPDDGSLLLFASRQYFYVNDVIRSKCLLQLAKPLVHKSNFSEMAAELCEFQQDREAAIQHWSTILQLEPLSSSANHAYVRLLSEIGRETEACLFIEKQLKQFPNNYLLLRLKVDWCCTNDLTKQESVYRKLIENHQDENWAHKELAKFLIQQFRHTESIEIAKDAISVRNNDDAAHCVLGLAYQAMSDYKLASESFRTAIKHSCDCIEAFEPLLECASTGELKREELKFIYDQLISQVTFGDALIEFQEIARNWYSAEELLKFLNFAVKERPDLWQSWVALAIQNRETGEYKTAIDLIDQAIEKFPLIPRLLLEKAEIRYYMNDLKSMEALLRKALEQSPGWHSVINRLSEILEYQNRTDEAIKILEKQIEKSPLTYSSYGYLGDLLWRAENHEKAIDTLFTAVKLSPTYYWAWNRLNEMSRTEEQHSSLVSHIDETCILLPDDSELARIHAKISYEPENRQKIYEEFLNRHPQAEDLIIDNIHFLVNNGKYDQALDLCKNERWNGTPPLSIKANYAWTIYTKGNTRLAIEEMNKIVENDQNYYDGWRFLVKWYDGDNNTTEVLRCLKHCQRLYPNNASVLCFVAEKLVKHAPDEDEEINNLLKQAYYLDPTDSYNGLTYIDKLLERKDFEEARSVLTSLKTLCDSAYISGRELALYCIQGKKELALTVWKMLISDASVDDNLISYCWNQLDGCNWATSASEMISEQRIESTNNPDVDINAFTGEYWAYHQVKEHNINYLEKKLKRIRIKDNFDSRVYEGYLRHLTDKNQNIPDKLFKNNYQKLHDDLINWKLISYIKSIHDEDTTLIKWMKDSYQRDGVEPKDLYFYSLAIRRYGDWLKSAEIVSQALDMPQDYYYDELLVWNAFDIVIQDNTSISLQELNDYITIESLSDVSQYIYSLIEALISLKGRSFDQAYSDISPLLRICQRKNIATNGSNIVDVTKNKVLNHLKSSINTRSLLGRLIWKWKLSNHF